VRLPGGAEASDLAIAGFDLLEKFDSSRCIFETAEAKTFMKRPGLESCYKLCDVTVSVVVKVKEVLK
jgi:hypothetical protein